MAHDVFISYASKNKQAADTICSELEARGIQCWIAPRDIVPGAPWAESIIDAIETAKVMVLVFSSAANSSDQIHREVERAIHKGISVVPLRLENVLPTRTLEYFISSHHWFDAFEPPLEQHIDRLAQGLTALLVRRADGRTTRRRKTMSPGPPPASEPGASSPARRPRAIAASPKRASASAPAAASDTAVTPTILVYAGTHRVLGHTVAIRTFQATGSGNRDAVRARFLREARALQVPHPNIIQVRDFGESDDLMYVVTDLLAGCSLGELIAREGPLPLPKFHAFVKDLTDATIAVHRHGGLISGLHPEIVRVVREDGREWLAISSAGISTAQDLLGVMNEAALRGQAASSELSYVAPELLMGKTADARADVFTVGVLAYQMATGVAPFQGRSLPELLGAMLGTAPQDLAAVRPDLGPAAAAIVMRCLAPDPQHRYAAAAEVLQAWPVTAPSGG
jgi:TIR domain-containing protein/protein kinase-like protein